VAHTNLTVFRENKDMSKIKTKPEIISIKDINKLVYGNKWKGDIDPTALRERLKDLMEMEQDFICLRKQVDLASKLFSSNCCCYRCS